MYSCRNEINVVKPQCWQTTNPQSCQGPAPFALAPSRPRTPVGCTGSTPPVDTHHYLPPTTCHLQTPTTTHHPIPITCYLQHPPPLHPTTHLGNVGKFCLENRVHVPVGAELDMLGMPQAAPLFSSVALALVGTERAFFATLARAGLRLDTHGLLINRLSPTYPTSHFHALPSALRQRSNSAGFPQLLRRQTQTFRPWNLPSADALLHVSCAFSLPQSGLRQTIRRVQLGCRACTSLVFAEA